MNDDMEHLIIQDLFFNDDSNIELLKLLLEELSGPLDNTLRLGAELRKRRSREEGIIEKEIRKYSDEEFKTHFRMKRSSFQTLLTIITKSISLNEDIIELRRKLLYTLWLLSKPDSFSSAGSLFNLAKSSGHSIFKEIVHSLVFLLPEFIKWPDPALYSNIANRFIDITNGIPGIIGVTGTCHILCKQPPNREIDYYNTSGCHSVILQGTCDPDGKFIDVFIGMPGRTNEADVFQQSPLYRNLVNNRVPLLPPDYHIVGDEAYPLLENVLTPFSDHGQLTSAQIRYNSKLKKVQRITKKSFEKLKATFERLQYLITADMELANSIIAACCVLHNFIIEKENERVGVNIKRRLNDFSGDSSENDDNGKGRALKKRRQIMSCL